MPLFSLMSYFGDALEAELAEHGRMPENIQQKIRTWRRDAADDAGIIAFVEKLERWNEGSDMVRKVLEIRDPSGRIVRRATNAHR
jgi:hypothetical protein